MDFLIGGQEVDVKSTTGGGWGWMIPKEAIDQLLLLLRINEDQSTCAFGLARARRPYLRTGENRDLKTSFSAGGRMNIWWLVQDFPYTPNFWTTVDLATRQHIMSPKGGTDRLVALFETCLEIPFSRVLIKSIAAQDDFMKRIRRNGGARDKLAPKGIAVLYSEYDRELMLRLGLSFGSREFMSYRPRNSVEANMLKAARHID